MKVYMVMFDWSTDDDSSVDVELFNTYKKAFDRFNAIISDEKKPDMSWAADAFDDNGEIIDGYDFDEHIETDGTDEYDCWWNLTNKNDWYVHGFLELTTMEVK